MNTLELSKHIGCTALLRTRGSFDTVVRITDVKQVYGCTRYYVTPVSGRGSVWVDASRITLQDYIPEVKP